MYSNLLVNITIAIFVNITLNTCFFYDKVCDRMFQFNFFLYSNIKKMQWNCRILNTWFYIRNSKSFNFKDFFKASALGRNIHMSNFVYVYSCKNKEKWYQKLKSIWNLSRPHSHIDHTTRRYAAIQEATFSTIHT